MSAHEAGQLVVRVEERLAVGLLELFQLLVVADLEASDDDAALGVRRGDELRLALVAARRWSARRDSARPRPPQIDEKMRGYTVLSWNFSADRSIDPRVRDKY